MTPSIGADEKRVAILAEAVAQAHRAIHAHPMNTAAAEVVNGWSVTYGITGQVQDPLDRAALGRFTPGAQINKELIYYAMFNVDGSKDYILRFAPGQQPPVEAFWSLTMSGMDSFLVDNPIDRYALNSRTKGLRLDDDGTLAIRIQRHLPAEGPENWLPSPAGPFLLCLRAYMPTIEILEGRYKPPPLTPL